jgi:hypothetical protein
MLVMRHNIATYAIGVSVLNLHLICVLDYEAFGTSLNSVHSRFFGKPFPCSLYQIFSTEFNCDLCSHLQRILLWCDHRRCKVGSRERFATETGGWRV